MISALSLLLLLAPGIEPSLNNGIQLTYAGEIVADKGEPDETRKRFTLKVVVSRDTAAADGARLFWSVKEDGRGGWAWPLRAGKVTVNDRWEPQLTASAASPTLLYARDTGAVVVPLLAPVFAAGNELKEGEQWQRGRTTFTVEKLEKTAGIATWPIKVTTPFGRKRTVYVAQESPLVAAVDEVVFMGQGEQFRLTYQLTGQQQLSPAALAKLKASFVLLEDLRAKLLDNKRPHDVTWTRQQLALVKAGLPALHSGTPFLADVVAHARTDLRQQSDRSGALTMLSNNTLKKAAPAFELKNIAGGTVSSDVLKDHVTVLHFWEYRDAPLKQPYGQTGFLDYLYRQRKADGVQVIGVSADPRLADPATAGAALRSTRKFQQFMNLSYPVLLDDGTLIKKLGDPRPAGASLPLFVVIDAKGKVVHYQAGMYEVQRNRGLEELDREVTKALRPGG